MNQVFCNYIFDMQESNSIFHLLRCNPHGVKEPVIVQSIKKEFDKPPYPQTYDKILKEYPDKIKKCIEDISNPASILFAFNDVTYAFQHIKVGRGIKNVQPMFFDYKTERLRKLKDRKRLRSIIDKNYGIDINPYALEFFKKFNVALQHEKSSTLLMQI